MTINNSCVYPNETYLTECKKYDAAFKRLRTENARLAKEAKTNQQKSMRRRMEIARELADYENLRRDVERYAPELLEKHSTLRTQEVAR